MKRKLQAGPVYFENSDHRLERLSVNSILPNQFPKRASILLGYLCCFSNVPLAGQQQFLDIRFLELLDHPVLFYLKRFVAGGSIYAGQANIVILNEFTL